jgi:hypothetical protein
MCVQRFDDSLNSAIHITYRISLRSSSMPEPRDPLLKVLTFISCIKTQKVKVTRVFVWGQRLAPAPQEVSPLKATELSGPQMGPPAEATVLFKSTEGLFECEDSVMIPPLVHQRRPCYDFYFL